MALKTTLNFFLNTLLTGSTGISSAPSDNQTLPFAVDGNAVVLPDGTAAGKANKVYRNRVSLPGGFASSLDLNFQSLPSPLGGSAQVLTKVLLICVFVPDGSPAKLAFNSGSGSNKWVAPWSSVPNTTILDTKLAVLYNPDGWAVDATHKEFSVYNGAGTAGDVIVWIVGSG